MKLVTTEFQAGGLHEKHVVATWNVGNHLSICFLGTGKPRKTCVEVAGRRTLRMLTFLASSPASKVETAIHTWYNKYT